VDRDGEQCWNCKRKPPEIRLVIHHEDNNNDNNTLSNLHLFCYRCNYLANPREPIDIEREEEREKVTWDELGYKTSLDVNRERKPKFLPYAEKRLNQYPEGVDYDDFVQSVAWVLDIVPSTAEKYIKPACSSEGPYEIVHDGKTRIVRKKKS